jgi:hypothetical protein
MKIFLFFLSLLVLSSCKDDAPRDYSKPEKVKVDSTIRPVEILFDDIDFQNDTIAILLKETGLCDNPNIEIGVKNPPCSPKFFKVLPFTKKQKLHDSFMILVKALVGDFPVRRVFVYQRENGKAILANRFLANVIEFRDNPTTGYDDILLVFNDVIDDHDYRYTCLYTWSGKKYIYNSCEEIDHLKVKPMFKDSMSIEIKKIIDRKEMAL